MSSSARHLVALCVAFAALALPAVAQADPDAVVGDCAADGTVDGNHSDADKKAALDRIPADLDEYSDCRSVIAASIKGPEGGRVEQRRRRRRRGSRRREPRPQKAAQAKKRRARAKRLKAKRERTEARARRLASADPKDPAVFEASNTSNGLPTPVLLALIALGLLAAAAGAMALGRHNQRFAATLRRVSLPFLRR